MRSHRWQKYFTETETSLAINKEKNKNSRGQRRRCCDEEVAGGNQGAAETAAENDEKPHRESLVCFDFPLV